MRAAPVVLLVAALATAGLASPAPGVGARPAAGAAFVDIGGDDTLVVLTPWETRWLANALENNSKWQCAPPGIRVPKVVKFFNRFCSGYSGYSRVAYWRAKWLLQSAVRFGGCGSFVLDGAPWRGVRIRAAEAWSYASNSDMAHVSTRVGETTQFRTKNGYRAVRCGEYRFPDQQTNIVVTI